MEIDGSDRSHQLDLASGDILALISDGIYEYTDEAGALFGEERVAKLIQQHCTDSMEDLSEILVQAARDFAGPAAQADDVTIVLVKRL